MTRETATLSAGSEIHVGLPAQPLASEFELALRDVVQESPEIAFAHLPLVTLPNQAPSLMLALYCRRGVDPQQLLTRLVPIVRSELERVGQASSQTPPNLGVMPISLGHPLDGLAQAIAQTSSELHVADVQAWQRARRPSRPWWLRWLPS
ncbi:MAG TPA: hypothetical protein DCQ06_04625 [Myxococcales bacterium]|nr:hypothetical protein [Myxococcales bacterium]HAN30860.1 hypothetical protein [Myxococcales bacterium]